MFTGRLAGLLLTISLMPMLSMAEPMSVKVEAQPLGSALNALAEQLGLQLVYDGALVTNLKAAALSGRMEPADALQRILAGSGLTYRFTSPTAVTLERSRDGRGTRSLGPVRVQGIEDDRVSGTNGSRDVTATEGTGSFTTNAMTIGSKMPRSIKDTPQSVSVLSHEQIEQQNINDFTQALRQAPGISTAQGDTSLETSFYSRGYEITSIQIDGGAPLTTRFAGSATGYFPQIDLSQFDHVEVLRGAAGLFNGYGDPSGTVNLVRKKPLDHQQLVVDAELGSWNHYRTVLDASAPLAFDGALRGRLVATWQSNEHFYDIAEDQKTLIYGVLDYDLTATTLVTAGISRTSQDSTPWWRGLPRYQTGKDLHLPRKTGLLFPWNRWDFDTTEIFASIEQQIGEDWKAKLNLTRNEQQSTRKLGYSEGSVNPVDMRGPRLFGTYNDYASDQLSAEVSVAGHFNVFGQRQEITLGFNRSDQDGGGRIDYATLIASSQAAPYQPYPGGPRYCLSTSASNPCPAGTIAPATPPINVFAFNPFDPRYNEPANPLPSRHYSEQGQVQSLAYANIRLTAFDRLHLETGLRWSRFENNYASEYLCTSTTTPAACVGRAIGDAHSPSLLSFSGEEFSWPPAVALSYDVTSNLTGYLGYTDIYRDQSSALDGNLDPLDPITGANVELGVKWSARNGRLNAGLSIYRIEQQGFMTQEPNLADRYKRNPDGSIFRDGNNERIVIANDGTELPEGRPDPDHICCYIQQPGHTQLSEGVDAELTGEVLTGWQVSASYTFSRNKKKGAFYKADQGLPFLSIQPEHLYKLWTSYDFGAARATGRLSSLTLSVGVNGQSEGYRSGSVCPNGQVGDPSPLTGLAPCRVSLVPYEFTVEPYAVFSGRADYRLNDAWSLALNIENILDKTYYQSVGTLTAGNWYGEPRSFTLSVHSTF